MTITQALIAAGGKGKRMKNGGIAVPGCKSLFMIQNKPLLFWNVLSLHEAGIKDIIIVCDDQKNLKKISEHLKNIEHVFRSFIYLQDPGFPTTAMIPTWAKQHLNNDFLYTFGHSIFTANHYKELLLRKASDNIVVTEFINPLEKSRYYLEVNGKFAHIGYPLCIDINFLSNLEMNNFNISQNLQMYSENITLHRVLSTLPMESNSAKELVYALSVYDEYIKDYLIKHILT